MKKNKQSLDVLTSTEYRYSIEVLHVKILSLWVKDDVLIFFLSYLCNVDNWCAMLLRDE